jgi:uncharacterized protein YjbI with pentapeptide repeats
MSDDLPQRPSNDNRDGWRIYWAAQGMPWRTEPEIGETRQAYLAEHRAVTPDVERAIYPFRDEQGRIKLDRADVEWLLATHESAGMRGPVDWGDPKQRQRVGLDLRGTDLEGANLQHLPLSGLQGGLSTVQVFSATPQQRDAAAILLQRANLQQAHLEGAALRRARLQNANLNRANLQDADLSGAHLEGAELTRAYLKGASLRTAALDAASTLTGASLDGAQLDQVHFGGTNLAVVDWSSVRLLGAAVALRAVLGTPQPAQDQADVDQAVAAARVAVGEAAWAAAFATGQALTLEEAIAEALEETPGTMT